MLNEKLTITLKEGIHIPLEICHTCPFFNTCMMSESAHIIEKNKKMEKLLVHKNIVSEFISCHFKIPKLPVYFYDNPHTMYQKLGFFWSQLHINHNCNCLMNSMYNDPIVVINSKKGVMMNQVHENIINELFEIINEQC